MGISGVVVFRKATNEFHNLVAINVLASFLLEGYRDVDADVAQAVKYLEQAMALGDTHSMNRLGMLYLEGLLLPDLNDIGKGVTMFRKVVESNDVKAGHNLSVLYRNGQVEEEGVEGEADSEVEAVRLLEKAIEKR